MDKYIELLRNKDVFEVNLQVTLDDLCLACPSNCNNICTSQEKVISMDKKVLEYFDLIEGVYEYKVLVKIIKDRVNKEILDDICSECEWFKYGSCEKFIL